ncbi:MAG: hypothetical protein L6R39_002643 [Caloplaca ligustica]|nr:MAG: hypothetical protein L6R39_002643 [Caloplaca ligustica]
MATPDVQALPRAETNGLGAAEYNPRPSSDALQNIKESWNSKAGAASYEQRTLECSRDIAQHLIFAAPQIAPGSRVLDNACGTGIVTRELLKTYSDVHIDAVDFSDGMLDVIQPMLEQNGWTDRVSTVKMNGISLQFEDGIFDVSFTNFAIFFFPDPNKGAKELYRTLKPGGTACLTAWQYFGWLPVLHKIQKTVKPDDPPFAVPMLAKWHEKETMVETLKAGGFLSSKIRMSLQEVMYLDDNIEELARSLTGLMEPMMKGIWDLGDQGGMRGALLRVFETQGDRFLVRKDGKVGLKLVAWLALATK